MPFGSLGCGLLSPHYHPEVSHGSNRYEVAFVIPLFSSVDLTEELELFDASEAVFYGYPFATVAFVASYLLFGEFWFVPLPLHRSDYPDIRVLLAHTLVTTVRPALDPGFVFGKPFRNSAFLEQGHVMTSAGCRWADMEHKAVFVRQHLGHEGEGLLLAGMVSFTFLLVLGTRDLLFGHIEQYLFKFRVNLQQFINGTDTPARPVDQQLVADHRTYVSDGSTSCCRITVEQIPQQIVRTIQFGIHQKTQQAVVKAGQAQAASAAYSRLRSVLCKA